MGAFFKGWRRKVGVVLLVMACAMAGAWVRSQLICDSISITICHRQTYVASGRNSIYWCSWVPSNGRERNRREILSTPLEDRIELIEVWLPLALTYPKAVGGRFNFSTIAIPLTLLSALLLLWPHRKRREPTQTSPVIQSPQE